MPMVCVRGCIEPRSHQPACTCTIECRPHDDHCEGCAVRGAASGLLCTYCSRRLRDHLGDRDGPEGPHGLAWAWENLAVAYPTIAGTSDNPGGRSTVHDREAERLASVISLRDDIRDWLGSVVADIAERTGLVGPEGVQLTTDHRRRHVGCDWHIVRRSQSWLLAHAEQLESATGIPDSDSAAESVVLLWDQAGDLMSRAHALAPWRPEPTHIDGVPCRCHAVNLHHHGDEVKCWTCGRAYTLEQYGVLCKVMARRFEETVGAR